MNYKIQALNGFNMYFDQLTNVFKARYEADNNFSLDELSSITGLNRRKARIILNFFADIGFSEKRTFKKTKLGEIIHRYDDFFQDEGTLWLMHYLQSSNEYLIIWNRIMNSLYKMESMKREDLLILFADLKDDLSEYSYRHHIGKEIRTILDAYTNQKLRKLNLIDEYDERYYIHRNIEVPELILLCAIIMYKEHHYPGATAIDINEICTAQNSPGRIFVQDEHILRKKLENLKNSGFISIESRGDLDQIRFKEGSTIEKVLEDYYSS